MRFFIILFISSIGFGQNYFGVKLHDVWTDTTLLKGPENVYFSDVWGFYYNKIKYAVIGSTEGAHFIKIESEKFKEVDFEPGSFSSVIVQHRDYKKYKNYIYSVCDEGTSSLQIFDISYLPDSVHKVYDSDLNFVVAHNIFIDTLKAKLYVSGPNNLGMDIYDISNPENPILDLHFTKYNFIHDCFAVNDTVFMNAGVDGLQVYYFGNQLPEQLGGLSFYPNQGYNHSGWLSENHDYYCFIDETQGTKIKYCDISDGIENIQINELFSTTDYLDYVPHNIIIKNDFAFVSNYNEGLRVFDLLDKPIKEVAYYDTYLINSNYKLNGAWGVYVFDDEQILISDRQNGLFLFSFPFKSLRSSVNVINSPFINAESKILFQASEYSEYSFNIYNANGSIVYEKEDFTSWINIPLALNQGIYFYSISNKENILIKSGKFISTN